MTALKESFDIAEFFESHETQAFESSSLWKIKVISEFHELPLKIES